MKKVMAVVLSAVLFGVLAGGTMVGINAVGSRIIAPQAVVSEENGTAGSGAPDQNAEEKAAGQNGESGNIADEEVQAQVLDVSDIVEAAMPQVVSITNKMLIQQQGYGSIFDYFYGGGVPYEYEAEAAGSGVILKKTDDELLIVTNNHVVENAEEISVTFIDGKTVDAAIKGTDSTIDLAVVAVKLSDIDQETLNQIQVATLHTKEDLKPGQGVIAIGNALGFGQSVTVGYISALGREITTEEGTNSDLIQVDAAINPGNSGGALLNMNGEVIGINVAKLADTEVEGVGYAIPIYKATDVIDNLSNAKTKVEIPEEKQGRLGVYAKSVTQQYASALNMPEGVLVVGFNDENGQEAAAKEAGIQTNDIITKFDGQSVKTAEELTRLVKFYEAGSKVQVAVQRLENGSYVEKTFEVTLGKNTDTAAGESQAAAGENDAKGENEPESKQNAENGTEETPSESGADGENGTDGSKENGSTGAEDFYEQFREFLRENGIN